MEMILEKAAREFLRRKDVIALTKIPNATLYELIKQNKFPRQIKLSSRLAVWDAQEIADWQAERMAERDKKTVH